MKNGHCLGKHSCDRNTIESMIGRHGQNTDITAAGRSMCNAHYIVHMSDFEKINIKTLSIALTLCVSFVFIVVTNLILVVCFYVSGNRFSIDDLLSVRTVYVSECRINETFNANGQRFWCGGDMHILRGSRVNNLVFLAVDQTRSTCCRL